jgi:flagellar motility protein MotE (MotC chaperone)
MIAKFVAKNRSSTLMILSTLLVASAVLRIGGEAGPAFAKTAQAAEEMPEKEAEKSDMPSGMSEAAVAATPSAQGLQMLMEELKQRETRLQAEEERVLARARALEVAEQAIDDKLEALNTAEIRLRETIALADGAAEGDLSQLTAVYERMKPKEAAALFEAMDPQFAAGFLGRMKPDVAAGILAKLTPQSAYSISVILAGRNAEVPKQ